MIELCFINVYLLVKVWTLKNEMKWSLHSTQSECTVLDIVQNGYKNVLMGDGSIIF